MMISERRFRLRVFCLVLWAVVILLAASCGDSKKNGPQSSDQLNATVGQTAGKSAGPTGSATRTPAGSPSSSAAATGTGKNTAAKITPTPTKVKTQQASTAKKTAGQGATATPKPTPAPVQNQYNGNKNLTVGKIIEFSHPSGYYNAPFTLTLKYNQAYSVYYTINGDSPTSVSRVYKASGIAINDLSSDVGTDDDVVTVRAAAFQNGKQVGATVTATYIINQKYGSFYGRYNNLAVISISTDKSNLYGVNGIFTNYTEHGRESERPAHVEFFDSDGQTKFSIDAGIRVYGGTSRALPQKSLKLVARKEYDPDNGKFKTALFPDRYDLNGKLIDRYDSFILRGGGNDSLFGGARNTLLRDALVHSLAGKISNIVSQAYRPVVVYINGDYSGVYNMRDDTDKDFLEQHYSIPKDDVAIITYGHENGEWFYKIDEGTKADEDNYKNMLSWISSNNMANSANYTKACKMLDMDNFVKYIAINLFANNRDWPHNNIRAWKYTGKTNSSYGQDGLWRFMLKDIDYSWGIYYQSGPGENVAAEETAHARDVLLGQGDTGEIGRTFASLMKNTNFKRQFLNFIDELVNNYYSTNNATAMITKMKNAMAQEYSHIYTNIWYDNINNKNTGAHKIKLTYNQWIKAVDTLYEYAQKRPAILKNLVKSVYG